jgi:hypothetical protein
LLDERLCLAVSLGAGRVSFFHAVATVAMVSRTDELGALDGGGGRVVGDGEALITLTWWRGTLTVP